MGPFGSPAPPGGHLPPVQRVAYHQASTFAHWNSEEKGMHVEMRPIESIRPYENNPRLNDAAVYAVAKSIKAFGFRQPIVVDEAGVIIVGHTRYKAALKLGL